MSPTAEPDRISMAMLHHHTRNNLEAVRDGLRLLVVDADGKPMAAMVPINDLERLMQLDNPVGAGMSLTEVEDVA